MEVTRAVLVTGASTGIGRAITERLAVAGHYVYAGARKDSDLSELGELRNVHSLRLDVTEPRDVEAAVRAVADGGRGLYGLVNNAGVLALGPIADADELDFGRVMAVNVHGPYRVTKAFAPLIVAAKGRIVTLGSTAGIQAVANASAYSMSKHAIEAFVDTLAEEMKPFAVEVSVIESSNRNTKIGRNVVNLAGSAPWLPDFSSYRDPQDVADAVVLALFEKSPKRRYLVVQNQDEAYRTIKKQIEQLVQINEGHCYTYDRSALIEMLDAALKNGCPRRSFEGSINDAHPFRPRSGGT